MFRITLIHSLPLSYNTPSINTITMHMTPRALIPKLYISSYETWCLHSLGYSCFLAFVRSYTQTSPSINYLFITEALATTNLLFPTNFFFLFNCMFYQLLRVQHSCSSTQSWGSVLPSIVETRDQNTRGCPLLFLNRNLGSFCA